MSGTLARSLGALGDAIGGTANVNFDANTLFVDSSANTVRVVSTSTLGNSRLNVDLGITARTEAASGNVPYFQLFNGNASTDLKTWRIGGTTAGALAVETVNDAYSAATQRMLIDSSGRLTTPAVPAFSVNSRQINGYFNNVTIIYKNIVHNNGSHYSTVSGRFTAPVAGRYFFSASAIALAASGNAQLGIRKNGTILQNNYIDLEPTFNSVTTTAVVDLAVNDFVDVVGYGAAAVWFDNGGTVVEYNNFSGFLIG